MLRGTGKPVRSVPLGHERRGSEASTLELPSRVISTIEPEPSPRRVNATSLAGALGRRGGW
jgi:hypothetical protein